MLCFERKGRRLYAYLEGELDHDCAGIMRAEIDNQLHDVGINELVIDLSGISFMDSSGIGLILGRYKQLKMRSGKLFIARPGRRIDRLLKIAGVYDIAEKI